MAKVNMILEAEESLKGGAFDYRSGISVVIEEDEDNDEQLKFEILGQNVFIKKEDIKEIIHAFKIGE